MARALATFLLCWTLVASAPPAVASASHDGTDAHTDPNGASVHVVDRSVTGEPRGGTGSAACVRRYVPSDLPVYKFPQAAPDAVPFLAPAPSPFHQAFDLYCGDTYLTTIWAIPPAALAAVADQTARELLAQLPFPGVQVATNPQRPVTGLETWFWIDGYDGEPLTAARAGFGIAIDLEVRLGGVDWDFGDGTHLDTTLDAGLGRAYPARSDVVHTYETRGAYTVRASFTYTARYRVDGGDWVELEAVGRTVERPTDVVEVRSLLTR